MRPFNAWLSLAALLCATLFLNACRSGPPAPPNPASLEGETLWLTGHGLRLKTKLYRSTHLSAQPVLIVVLHGDSPAGPPSYQYTFATRAASRIDDSAVAAILRPGYADDTGDRSQGNRGLATGDNYTPEVVDAITVVIEQLQTRLHPAATVLVGHSGGAAISADILGRWPKTVGAALLVSCPCDLGAWRRHMPDVLSSAWWLRPITPIVWRLPVKSLSPINLASGVRPSVLVRMLVGSDDRIAPPRFTQEYTAALQKQGVQASVLIAPGLPHDMLLEPVVFEQLRALSASARRHSG